MWNVVYIYFLVIFLYLEEEQDNKMSHYKGVAAASFFVLFSMHFQEKYYSK